MGEVNFEPLVEEELEAERIIEEARRRAEEIVREAERRAEEILKARVEEARRAARRKLRLELHRARLEGSTRLQKVKNELLERVFDEATARLREFVERSREEYARVLRDLIVEALEALGEGEFVVLVNKRDWNLAGSMLPSIEEEARRRGRSLKLHLGEEAVDVMGGAVILSADGRVIYNNSLEARLEHVKNMLAGEVLRILMGGEP